MKLGTHKNWYVIYTRSKWEKKADQLLREQNIRSFCPLIKTQRKWADRNKIVEFPLFSSYLFVHADLREQTMVRQTAGIVNFVYYCGKPAVISDDEICRIENLVKRYPDLETVNLQTLNIGDRVKIKNNNLFDWQGEILEIQGKSVIMVIELLNCALVAKIKVPQTELVIQ